jgi:hypothetical protein
LVLAIYAFGLLSFCLGFGIWWLIPWLVLYTAGYGYVAGLAFVQGWQTHRSGRTSPASKVNLSGSSEKILGSKVNQRP